MRQSLTFASASQPFPRAVPEKRAHFVGTCFAVLVIHVQGRAIGRVYLDGVIGKTELIDYATAIDADGRVRQVEILTYRESHGYEVRNPRWRQQFVGKGVATPPALGEGIANISGATLSCRHLTDGVRRLLLLHAADSAARS